MRWKALRGGKTDNVPSVVGMTDKAAEKLLANPQKLEAFLSEGTNAADYARNLTLIQLKVVPCGDIEISPPMTDLEALKHDFEVLRFTSLVKDPAWKTFAETFAKIY